MLSNPPTLPLLTVLVIEIQTGRPVFLRKRLTNAAPTGSDVSKARSKVYWISVIGPHWRYGDKDEDEENLRPLIDWRHTTHDQDSYEHLQVLAGASFH